MIEETKLRTEAELEAQKRLLVHTINAQENERSRIASDLHDNIISQLIIVRLLNQNAESREMINTKLHQVMIASRQLSHDLTPPLLEEMDFLELAQPYVIHLNVGIDFGFYAAKEHLFPLENDVKLHLFRIFQELTTNVLKHAHASKVEIHYRSTAHYLSLIFRDNGVGIQTAENAGIGLKNIESRAQLLRATYKIKARTHAGSSFALLIKQARNYD